jgi:4-nitrophenyl phosphatase
LRYCCPDKEPIVVGKPNKPFMDCITKVHDLDRKKTIMIGDRLDTDVSVLYSIANKTAMLINVSFQILFGINGGTASMMVLTGEFISSNGYW